MKLIFCLKSFSGKQCPYVCQETDNPPSMIKNRVKNFDDKTTMLLWLNLNTKTYLSEHDIKRVNKRYSSMYDFWKNDDTDIFLKIALDVVPKEYRLRFGLYLASAASPYVKERSFLIALDETSKWMRGEISEDKLKTAISNASKVFSELPVKDMYHPLSSNRLANLATMVIAGLCYLPSYHIESMSNDAISLSDCIDRHSPSRIGKMSLSERGQIKWFKECGFIPNFELNLLGID